MADFVNVHEDPTLDAFFTSEYQRLVSVPSGVRSTILAVLNKHGLACFKNNFPIHMDPYLVEKLMSKDNSTPDFRLLPPADEIDQEIPRKSFVVCNVIVRFSGSIKMFLYVGSAAQRLRGAIDRIEKYEDRVHNIKYMGQYVQKATCHGCEIEGICALAVIPRPAEDLVPKAQAWTKFIEARFTFWFWTLYRHARTDPAEHYRSWSWLRRWPFEVMKGRVSVHIILRGKVVGIYGCPKKL